MPRRTDESIKRKTPIKAGIQNLIDLDDLVMAKLFHFIQETIEEFEENSNTYNPKGGYRAIIKEFELKITKRFKTFQYDIININTVNEHLKKINLLQKRLKSVNDLSGFFLKSVTNRPRFDINKLKGDSKPSKLDAITLLHNAIKHLMINLEVVLELEIDNNTIISEVKENIIPIKGLCTWLGDEQELSELINQLIKTDYLPIQTVGHYSERFSSLFGNIIKDKLSSYLKELFRKHCEYENYIQKFSGIKKRDRTTKNRKADKIKVVKLDNSLIYWKATDERLATLFLTLREKGWINMTFTKSKNAKHERGIKKYFHAGELRKHLGDKTLLSDTNSPFKNIKQNPILVS